MWRARDILLLGLVFGPGAAGIARYLPAAVSATATCLGADMASPAPTPWVDKLDPAGQPHTCRHRDGHRLGLFADGWWAYHADYQWTPPGQPHRGPDPAGPFPTLPEAKRFVEAQGWASAMPF